MTEESAVKVCVRVRPLIAREESTASENAEPVQLFWKTDKKSIHQIDDGNSTKSFSFDRVFTAAETTNHLYQEIAKPLVVSTVEGYNGTIFAYGQTSSGKTFTMMGSDRIPGVIPLAVEDVFQTIKTCPKKEFLLRVSYMEIYNETVTDLLVDSWKRKPLEVREAINKNIYVADLTEELVTSPAQALAWIRKGEKNRHYGKTKMNQRSSRSHTIFRMILESRERSDPASGENADGVIIVSHLNLVDLAGSERASQTGAEGTRFKEGCNINRSLFTLGQVIKKLTDEGQKGFTNYRDSKLTRILQNSLGGNAKTVIICTITPVTVDETLSTLQFASTAKKMKNDPHVTEVSDDGALLKRYRNEIVDLKRRLHEVSSVTQTTATEKEVLSQLLQEKDQLQREQEDRIRNLTQLLVTSSNSVSFPKIPKRRVTWGGKMHKLARLSGCDGASSDLSFAESFSRKRKADRSCLAILGEDDEDFNWEIPDGPSDEMEMSQSSVTVRSFEESPRDFVSSERLHELSGKVSNLELQLEMESQQKEEAMTKVETLDGRVAELELQLQTEAQQKLEAMEKIQPTEQRAAELELQLQTEAQHKLEAMEKVEMLEVRVADLDRRLEEQSCTQTETDKQMRREFAETIQLCETLASEKEMVAAERDYLKQELGMFIEQTKSLEKEKATLSKELEEKGEMDEFKSLEEEFRKEHENEMQNEISCLRKALESSELQCLELRNKLETLSEELKKKTEFAEDLQSMSGKDLVQEVAKLRRSLDDAEGLSRDTKKDWAVLRSQNIALEELNVTLTANHEKMDAEVKSLRIQLETEKSRYRKMQSDLQKELNVAFDENTKLTTLLDGKVPKNLIDSVELERTVANLNKELTASREAEGALRAQLEELASFQTLPDKIDSLMKQVCELTEELCAVETHKDSLLSAQAQCQEEAQQLRDSLQTSQDEILKTQADLSAAVLREKELSQQCVDVTQQLDSLRSNLERSDVEKSQLMATIEETGLKLEERERQMATLEEKLNEVQQLTKDLEEKLADSDAFRTTEEEISKELQERLNQLTEELQHVQAEKDALLSEQNAGAQRSAEEMENLLSTVTALTAERDQLRTDLQENVEMMIDHQEELRTALEKNRVQKEQIKQLETTQTSRRDVPPSEMSAQLEELQTHTRTLAEELESVRAERDSLLSERTANTHSEEVEELLSRVTSLSEERDQLQDTLEGLRQEKQQLRAELEDRMEMVAQAQSGFNQPEKLTPELQTQDENITQLQQKIEQLQATLQAVSEQKSQLEDDLQRNVELATETQSLLHSLQQQLQEQNQRNTDLERLNQERQAQLEQQVAKTESLLKELQEQKQKNSDHMNLCEQKESDLEQQTRTLTEQLKSAQAERDALLFEKETSCQTSTEKVEKLLSRVTSLSEERDQLQDTLEGLRQEEQQLRAELEDRMETVDQLEKELQICRARQALAEAEADSSQQLLSETNTTVSALREQLSSLDHSTSGVKDTVSSRLQDSAEKLQESFRKFQQFEDTCSKYRCTLLDKVRTVRPPMKHSYLPILPKPTLKVYNAVSYLGQQTVNNLESIVEHLQMRARSYKILFEKLVKKDLAVFEERRLQDVLLCRVQAPSYSVKDEDFHALWEPRLTELLDKRQLYLQQMAIILEKLWASMTSCPSELSAEVRDKERFTEQMQAVFANQPTSFSELHRILSCEQDHRSTVAHSRAMTLQAIFDEQNGLCKEVMLLDSQAYSQLSSERSKSSTLLQALEGAPLKTELSLLKDNQQLVLQLQQTEDKVKALCAQIEQLEDAQIKANNTVSNHKEAMQLLQTELQDSRAQVEDKENTIQTLNRRLHQSEGNSSPSAAELEKLRVKLFEKDVELNSASAKHKQEIQRMTTLLNEKEESLRKLKETLRKSQQQGEESFLQGEDLHARLTNPRGLIKSSILLEKTKLEEEVKQLQVKISQLESSVSSQQAEISKWKNRAIRMKGKSTAEVDRPSSPCTPTKRGLPMASDSSNVFCSPKKFLVTPKKVLDSPRKVLESPRKLLDSPKSSFFDVGGSSELLSRSCPRQFFDNSSLGTIPEVSQVPDTPDAEKDADRKEEWWPKSPNGEEMCKTQ
ncbi:centromere-associated protein E isoform X4 [Micropterus salmoides]|uniref:centromere-associated protein E isoform X4 n=1 Tax=Micropterus salmoides TaxID=27706 RepID=UPI0018EC579A|nr:centromere-associated protein E isoform X4 [Micropterus salmoides]